MADKLSAALAWAARGFRVFPIAANERGGRGNFPLGAGYPDYATSDPERIKAWWIGEDYNIGCSTDGLIVLDIDVKNGKPGVATFIGLGLEFDSLVVRTTTGGYHVYYQGIEGKLVGQAPLGAGLDVRSHHGYVLAPGSEIDGKPYSVEIDAPLAFLPPEIASRLRSPQERPQAAVASTVPPDTREAIAIAIDYLHNTAEIAIEGAHGDDTTYRVAARVRDFAISERQCLSLMATHWNARCLPPWPIDELAAKIENAYSYATSSAGIAHPQTYFGTVNIAPAPPPASKPIELPVGVFEPGKIKLSMEIPPRPWVMTRLLMRRVVTTLIGAGSAGKSTLILTIAAHLALGKDFLNFKCKTGPSKSIVYNAEDDMDEMSRRMHAICQLLQLDLATVNKNVIILTGDEMQLMLTDNAPPTVKLDHCAMLLETIARHNAVMVALDPLVELHTAQENDAMQMKYVMGIVRMLAQRGNVAALIGHHASKSQGRLAGDAGSARGSTAVINSARVSVTMETARPEDCDRYGISEDERNQFVRLDDAKTNMSLGGPHPLWLRRRGVSLVSGDDVGALEPVDIHENARGAAKLMATTFVIEMTGRGAALMSLPEAIQVLQSADPIYAQLPANTVRSRIERFIGAGIEIEGGYKLRIDRNVKGGRSGVFLVMG